MQLRRLIILLLIFFIVPYLISKGGGDVAAQSDGHRFIENGITVGQSDRLESADPVTPRAAFLRSLILPGWGHFYAGSQHIRRGGIHLATDAALIGAMAGFNIKANRLENDYISFTLLRAGVDLSSRERSFRLAVGEFKSLDEYNDYQLRTRNWHRVIDDTPGNRWRWSSEEDRIAYRNMRSDSDLIRNQLPAFAALMVVNRVFSAISAYNRVKRDTEGKISNRSEIVLVPVMSRSSREPNNPEMIGISANLKVRF